MVNSRERPGFYAGMLAIKEWIDKVYPGDLSDIFVYDETMDDGIRAIYALRWAVDKARIPKDTEPAHFYEETSNGH